MDIFERIFVAIDFSPGSDEALRQAHDHARSTAAKLAVCHVVPNELRSNMLFPGIGKIAALKVPLEVERIAQAVLGRVTEVTGRTEAEFELIVDEGTPYAAIMTNAEKWLADLIVVGSHGVTGLSAGLLGNVTNKILRYAHCPVLVARPGERDGGIVVGTDFSDPSLPAVKTAVHEAKRIGADLTLVHCLDLAWSAVSYPAMAFGGAPTALTGEDLKELELAAADRLDNVLKQLDATGQTRITHGVASSALVEIASELKARLLVIGTVGRTGLRRVLLGSVAETVAREAPCSVLVVRLHPG